MFASKGDQESYEFIKIILQNAKDLLEDSRILMKGEKYKRSAFLAITAFEETSKITLMAKKKGFTKDIFNHEKKFEDFRKSMESAVQSMLGNEFERAAESFGLKETAEQLKKRFLKENIGPHDLKGMRESLLYAHPKGPRKNYFIEDKRELTEFTNLMFKVTESNIRSYQSILDSVEAELFKSQSTP